jgi:hypothetical protein
LILRGLPGKVEEALPQSWPGCCVAHPPLYPSAPAHPPAARRRPAGLAALLLISLNVLRGTQGKLAQFLADVTGEDGGEAAAALRADGPKAD